MTAAAGMLEEASGYRRLFTLLAVFVLGLVWLFLGRMGPVPERFWLFVCLYALAWAAGLFFMAALPKGVSTKETVLWIAAAAILCRLLLIPFPVSDDVNRYLWEGKMLSLGVNPYMIPPDHSSVAHLRDGIWSGINHKDMTAVYPPGVTYVFALAARIQYSFGFFKVITVLFDLATLFLIMRLLFLRRRDLRWSVIYGLNPVTLVSFAGQAHLDSIMVFFMCASLLAYSHRRWVLMFLLAGLAFQAKYLSIILLPFFVRKDNLKHAWMFIPAAGLPFIPFLLQSVPDTFRSLVTLGTAMAHNGSIHGLLRLPLGEILPATVVCAGLFMILFYLIWRRRFGLSILHAGMLVLGALFILSPTVHFWYLVWILPFLCFYPAWSWGVLCLTAGLYFVADRSFALTGIWRQPVPFQVAQWAPFFFLLIHENLFKIRRRAFRRKAKLPGTYSIIIPVLNAAAFLEKCLNHIGQLRDAPMEVLVVDGGSSDESIAMAEKAGARVVRSQKGRGQQIDTGIRAASGDVVVVLHADTHIFPDVPGRILDAFRQRPDLIGGAVGQRFTESSFGLAFVELLNDIRAGFFGIAFGDQVQFFRRDAADAFGLMPPIPLMEDVESSIRMGRYGQRDFLWGGAEVSNYKWQAGFGKRFILVVSLLGSFFMDKLMGKRDFQPFYEKYYGKKD